MTQPVSSTVVTLPYDILWRPLVWAKENCPTYITNTIHDSKPSERCETYETYIDYVFSSETDALMFALKWK